MKQGVRGRGTAVSIRVKEHPVKLCRNSGQMLIDLLASKSKCVSHGSYDALVARNFSPSLQSPTSQWWFTTTIKRAWQTLTPLRTLLLRVIQIHLWWFSCFRRALHTRIASLVKGYRKISRSGKGQVYLVYSRWQRDWNRGDKYLGRGCLQITELLDWLRICQHRMT